MRKGREGGRVGKGGMEGGREGGRESGARSKTIIYINITGLQWPPLYVNLSCHSELCVCVCVCMCVCVCVCGG